ncbi:MAG: DoxX family protein [Pseudomonadota bacterium]
MLSDGMRRGLSVGGRSGLASLFLLGALNKCLNYSDTIEGMTAVGLAPSNLLLPLTILLEMIGGIALVAGRLPAFYGGFALAFFTLATNAFFHRFWTLSDPMASLELSLFFKNVAIAGALVFAAITEGERHTSDRRSQSEVTPV